MRQSTHETRILTCQEEIVGIALGFDFCGEHYVGIPDIYHCLGVIPDTEDIWSYRPTASPDAISAQVQFWDYPRSTKLCPAETRMILSSDEDYLERILLPRHSKSWNIPIQIGKSGIAAAWNRRGIFIRCFTEKTRNALKMVHDHLLQGDVLLTPGLGNPNTRGGINILIASKHERSKADVQK